MTEGTGSLRGRLRRVSLAVPLLLAAAAVLGALAPAASAAGPAGASVGEPPASLSATPSARGARGLASDWVHVCQVADWRFAIARRPGASCTCWAARPTRECVTDESAWSSDLRRRLGGKPAAGYVMSSSCQTFIEDARIINALPRGRGVAVIMIGLTRFYTVHINATLSTTAVRTTPPGPWYQHHYDSRAPLPLDEKRALVANWRTRHLAGFTDYYRRP